MQTRCFSKLLSNPSVYLLYYLYQLCFHLDQSVDKPSVKQAPSPVCKESSIWLGASDAGLYMNGVAKLQNLAGSLNFSSLWEK